MENAYGLVAGIANYQRINKLPKSILADAKAIREVLTDPNRCAYAPENVEILLDGEATREGLVKALTRLAQRCKEESTVFFYLSGHGGRIKSGQFTGEYLLPVDVDYESTESLAATAISGSQLTQLLRSIPARKVVVVFDTCFSGGVGEPKSGDASEFEHIPEHFYEILATGRGRVIIASSLSNEVSYVLPGAANSVFTEHMLAGLRGGVPGPGGVIRIFNLFDYLQPRVTESCPRQHPFFKAAVQENFPIALYLGGKEVGPAVYQSIVNPFGSPSGKTGRIMRQLDLLLGAEQKLSEHDRSVLSAALSLVTKNGSQPMSADTQQAADAAAADEIQEVVERSHDETAAVVRPFKYPNTELLSALLRIGLRLDLRRGGMNSSDLSNNSSWTLDNWLSYLTEEIVCERGIVRFHLLAPGENWIGPLTEATAVAMEGLWQQLRSVLTRNEMSFAVTRSRFEIDHKLGTIPKRVFKLIREAAQRAAETWPNFPHFGERPNLPALEDLLPLPESNIRCPVVFQGRNGCPVRLRANGTIAAESSEEQGGRIEYWPEVEGPVSCVLECDEGGAYVPLVCSRLGRLYSIEAAVFEAATDRLDACRRLGLKNDALQMIWPRIVTRQADRPELATALHILRDAFVAYEKASLAHASLLDRRDTYWDAMEIIRKQIMQEE